MGYNQEKTENQKNNDDLLARARTRFAYGIEADSYNSKLAREDMRFRAGDQWPEDIVNKRNLESRPCLTVNKIPGNVHQIVNEIRQNNPSILVSPYDNHADPETANIIQGLVRSIENNSNADNAYDDAIDAAVSGGRGYFRIVTEYADHMSFNQEIRIEAIKDPDWVILDPSYKLADGSDANWAFYFEDIPKDEFEQAYPDSEPAKSTFDWDKYRSDTYWFREDSVRVAEYYEKTYEKEKLYLLPDNSTALESDIETLSEEYKKELGLTEEVLKNLKYREAVVPKVYWYKINGVEILEKTEWPSRYIPIIPVHGEELIVDGRRVFEGIIRHAKDPQRMYNYWATCETEAIALAPKAPWIGAEGQFEGHESKWDRAHLDLYSYLEYKPTTIEGTPVPPPQRQFGTVDVQAITQARMLASDDLKATTSIYDASMGQRSNEKSGIAITRRAQQAQTSNFHFSDNLRRSIRHSGKIMVELLPKIYDTERVVRILNPDDEQEIITVNKMFKDKNGKEKFYDFSIGKYDVNVSSGPGYATKRQEAVEAMLALTQHNPQIFQAAGDLMVKSMDWDGAKEIAERIKKILPPQIVSDKESPISPQIKAQMDQMGQMVEQLTKTLNETQSKLDDKMIEIESKERIEMAKIEKDLQIKSAELRSSNKHNATPDEVAGLHGDIQELKQRLDLIGFEKPINEEEIAEQLEQEIAQLNINPTGEGIPGTTGIKNADGELNE